MEQHIAIDLGGSKSQVCIRNPQGEILSERIVATHKLGPFLATQPPSRVVMETCAESWAVDDATLAANHELRIVPGSLVRALGVGSRGIKKHRRDARLLSEVSSRIDLPSVHLRSPLAREIQTQLGLRHRLVGFRTMLINSARGWLRTQAVRVGSGGTLSFAKRVRGEMPTLPSYIERQLDLIEALGAGIEAAHRELTWLAKQSEVASRLRTVPGIGILTSLAFVAVVDDIRRFQDAHRLESYVGLTPGEHSSGERQRRTSINKAGSSLLRFLLIEGAWRIYRLCPQHQMVLWAKEIEKRRGRNIAIVALARKVTGILFAIWRDGSSYRQ